MTAAALVRPPLFARLDARGVRRGLAAGAAWGLVVGAGLITIEARRCGVICFDDAALTLLASIALGLVSIGPLAALGRPTRPIQS
jgi:hypothetical protein